MSERTATKVVGFHLDEGFSLTATLLEKELARQREAGVAVKAFLYCNPHNPLGVVYPKELTLQLMEVCKEHQVEQPSPELHLPGIISKGPFHI